MPETFGEALHRLMSTRGFGIRALASQVPCDPSHLSKIRLGQRGTSAELAKRLDDLLDAKGSLTALNANPRSSVTVDRSPTQEDDVKRRAALQLIAAVATGATIPPGIIESLYSGLDKALPPTLDLDEWEATVHEYGQLIVTRPGGTLVPDLTADIFAANELLDRHHDATDQAALMRIIAGLSGVLAIALGSHGPNYDWRAARTAWSAARRAADASGDRDLRVWVRGRAAQDAYWTQRPAAVVSKLADEAVEIAAGTPSAGLTQAHAASACLAAHLGDTRQTQTSLDALKQSFDDIPDETPTYSALTFRECQVRWTESYVHTQAGDPRAHAKLDYAHAAYDDAAPRTAIKNLHLMRATVLVKEGEINAGLTEALTTLHTHPQRETADMNLLARRVLSALPQKAQSLPAARELRETIPHPTATPT